MSEKLLAGRYQIVSELSSGGFGQTFLATDRHLPGYPLCVVKQLKTKYRDDSTLEIAKRLFNREAEILYKLGEHERIPRLMAHFDQEGEFYLVQEFIEGHLLNAEIEVGKPLGEQFVLNLLRDILEVLAFVHQHNVIHRDLKPTNLIRRKRDRKIVLIDFGAVKALRDESTELSGETSSRTIAIGSPGYMPNEQLAGQPSLASDIYAVGVIGLEALTGLSAKDLPKDPYSMEHSWNLCEKMTRVSISPSLARFLERMVCYDYRQRYQNAMEALQELEKIADTLNANHSTIISSGNAINQANKSASFLPQQTTILAQTKLLQQTQLPSLSQTEYRNRSILINKVKNFWIKGVLEASLHSRVVLELGLAERNLAIERPWSIVWSSTHHPQSQNLPTGTKVIDKLKEMGVGRSLLILGEPGAGKTTTLLEVARDLIVQAEQDSSQLIPVVFNLSSWTNEHQSIADWLIQELHIKYQVAKEIGKSLVTTQQLFLLLDGLDEVALERRDLCIQALNQFIQLHGQTELVVCSRLQDYEALTHRLRLQSAVLIQPLNLEQIEHYLLSMGEHLKALAAAVRTDEVLQELVRSPLMLSIMTLAYQGITPELGQKQFTIEEYRKHLFDAYIQQMFDRRVGKQEYSQQQTMAWLTWLAKQLLQQSQTVFLIERLQPDWLSSVAQKWSYSLTMGLLGGVFTGIILGINVGILFRSQTGLLVGFFLGIGSGLLAGLILGVIPTQIETVETLKWSWKKAKASLPFSLRVGLSASLIMVLGIYLGYPMLGFGVATLKEILIYGSQGFAASIIFLLLRGLSGNTIEASTVPNQGIWRSFHNSLLFGGVGVITLGVLASQVGIPLFGVLAGIFLWPISPAGLACFQHFTLRLTLYRQNCIPWNLRRFLDYANQLVFLQKIGGGYIFIHRLLLEHFAYSDK